MKRRKSTIPVSGHGNSVLRNITVLLVIIFISAIAVPVSANADTSYWPNSVPDANSRGRWPSLAEIPANSWIVVDLKTGEEIIKYNEHDRVFPASTTKIMTALTVLSDPEYDPERVLTSSAEAVNLSWDSSKIYLQEGETIVMKDALAAIMLASGNDAANVLAESLSGSIEEFARRMTVDAFALGAESTSFMNPHGLQDENHYTTASDLAVIAREAMQYDEFRQLVSSENYSLPASNMHHYNGWNLIMNTNRLMRFDDSYLYSEYIHEITGVKTGTTSAAGYCLVSTAVTHDGKELLSVLLGVPYNEIQGSTWIYTRTLLEEAAKAVDATSVSYDDFISNRAEAEPSEVPAGETDSGTAPTDQQNSTDEENSPENQKQESVPESTSNLDNDLSDSSETERDFWFWPAVVLAAITGILIIIVLTQRHTINMHRRRIRPGRRTTRK